MTSGMNVDDGGYGMGENEVGWSPWAVCCCVVAGVARERQRPSLTQGPRAVKGMDSWGTLVDRLSRNRLKRVDASKLFRFVQRGKSTRHA